MLESKSQRRRRWLNKLKLEVEEDLFIYVLDKEVQAKTWTCPKAWKQDLVFACREMFLLSFRLVLLLNTDKNLLIKQQDGNKKACIGAVLFWR